jgi:hypothetical protein
MFAHEDPGVGHFPRNINMGFRGRDERRHSGAVFRVALADDAVEYAPG